MKWRWQLLLWLMIIFLLLPPFNVMGINSVWILEMVVLGVGLVNAWYKEDQLRDFLHHWEVLWLIVFIVLITLSGLVIIEWLPFIKFITKFWLGFWLMWLAYVYGDNRKLIIKLMLFSLLMRVWLESLLYIQILADKVVKIFYESLSKSIIANLGRNRTMIGFFGEPLIIVGIYFWFTEKKAWKWLGGASVFGAMVIAFMSNWRGRFLTVVLISSIGVLWGIIVGNKNKKKWVKHFVIWSGIFGGVLLMLNNILTLKQGYSVVDRLLNKNYREDVVPVEWRKQLFEESLEMAKYSWLGVGGGQFYVHTNHKNTIRVFNHGIEDASKYGPHNLFFQFLAETGWLGLGWLIIGLGLMFVKDIKDCWLLRMNSIRCAFIMMFWGIILEAQFYPVVGWEFFVLFFGLRGLLLRRV